MKTTYNSDFEETILERIYTLDEWFQKEKFKI
jgi:hypothetical protein